LANWADAERDRFALWLAPAMAAGAACFFVLRAEPAGWLAPALAAAALAAVVLARQRAPARATAALGLAAAVGLTAAQVATWRAPGLIDVPGHAVVATGIVRTVEPLPEGRRVTLERVRLDGADPLARWVRIRLRGTDPGAVAAGDTIAVRALVMRPPPPDYPGGWDVQRDAFYQGLGAYGMALGNAEWLAEAAPPWPAGAIERLREGVAGRVGRVLPGAVGAIAATMLTGETSAIPEADRRAFRDAGLAHLLAIAGLHVGIVMGLVFAAVRFALALWEWAALNRPIKEIAAVAALAAAGGYMLLTGAHLPVQRSVAMAALFTLAAVAGRRALSLRGLALAMAAMVLAEPYQVLGVSFQMSFSAVLALIAGFAAARGWLWRLRGQGGVGRRLAAGMVALALSAALAGTASAPFAAYHFGQVQLYNVLANMAAVPLTALVVMPLGLVALALMPFGAEAVALVPMGWGVGAVLWVARTVAAWPAATVLVPRMPPWGLAALALGIAWVGLWRTRPRHAGWLAIALGLASPVFAPPPDVLMSADGRLVGLKADDGMFVQAAGSVPRFTVDAWRALWRARLAAPLGCGRAPCPLRVHPDGPAAMLVRGDAGADSCQGAAVVVSLEPVRLACGVPVVDRFSVWRQGAVAIWLDPAGARIVTDRDVRGERRWMPRPTPRSRIPPGLTPAPTEPLPTSAAE
jgi:competence protein ComEC